jgi:hypothetical protein
MSLGDALDAVGCNGRSGLSDARRAAIVDHGLVLFDAPAVTSGIVVTWRLRNFITSTQAAAAAFTADAYRRKDQFYALVASAEAAFIAAFIELWRAKPEGYAATLRTVVASCAVPAPTRWTHPTVDSAKDLVAILRAAGCEASCGQEVRGTICIYKSNVPLRCRPAKLEGPCCLCPRTTSSQWRSVPEELKKGAPPGAGVRQPGAALCGKCYMRHKSGGGLQVRRLGV